MCCNMAWLGSWLKDGPAQCMNNTSCYTGTERGTERRPLFLHIWYLHNHSTSDIITFGYINAF